MMFVVTSLGFLLSELASVDEPLHQRLILGDLHRTSVPYKVGPAVTNLRQKSVSPSAPAMVAVVPMPRCSGCCTAHV